MVKRNAEKYTLKDGKLFCHGYTHVILTGVSEDQCTRIMEELREGICGSHVGEEELSRWRSSELGTIGQLWRRIAWNMHNDASSVRSMLIGITHQPRSCGQFITYGLSISGE